MLNIYQIIINWYYLYRYTLLFLIFLLNRNMTKDDIYYVQQRYATYYSVFTTVKLCLAHHEVDYGLLPKIFEYCNPNPKYCNSLSLSLNPFIPLFFHLSVGVFSSNSMLLWQTAVHHPPRRCLLQLPEQVSIIHTIHYIHTTRVITHTLFLILCSIAIQILSSQLHNSNNNHLKVQSDLNWVCNCQNEASY